VPNLSTSMPQVLAKEVGCGAMVIIPPGQGLKHTLDLLHGFVAQRIGYRFRVYVISSIFISLPPW